ncbi:hypothetical protein SAMN05518855_1004165 [Paenibacillus sp. CF384]|nr:hypothetical protein SAMN05518855_1004165 [Paenibacillus sp. CF384]
MTLNSHFFTKRLTPQGIAAQANGCHGNTIVQDGALEGVTV